jgi:hypothetical protein
MFWCLIILYLLMTGASLAVTLLVYYVIIYIKIWLSSMGENKNIS